MNRTIARSGYLGCGKTPSMKGTGFTGCGKTHLFEGDGL
jgi:hypothetical protein